MIDTKRFRLRLMGATALVSCSLALTGCMSGLDIASNSKVDQNVSTGSVPGDRSSDSVSDELTVRNAVSSADISKVGQSPIPWANTTSGSAGVISNIAENNEGGTLCRQFTTTRHSYQGIAKFDGRTCLLQTGEWHLMSFMPHDRISPSTDG